jgi:hypothetical protein
MDVIELINRCRSLGAVLKVEEDSLLVRAPAKLPDDLRVAIKENKTQVILCLRLSVKTECHNPLTPHETHEYPWECDPNSCYCYRVYGYPHMCPGVPCRWVFPDKNKINGINSNGGKTH